MREHLKRNGLRWLIVAAVVTGLNVAGVNQAIVLDIVKQFVTSTETEND